MKKYLIVTLVILTSLSISAQSVGVSFSPIKNGLGCFIESWAVNDMSILAGFDFGKYQQKDMFGRESVNIDEYYAAIKYDKWIVGYKYNNAYGNGTRLFNLNEVQKHSIELGFLIPLEGRFNVGFMYDIINYEGRVMFAFSLKK